MAEEDVTQSLDDRSERDCACFDELPKHACLAEMRRAGEANSKRPVGLLLLVRVLPLLRPFAPITLLR